MASQMAEAREVSGQPVERHLEPNEVAAYVDRATTAEVRARIQSHLTVCDQCRAEVMEIARMAATLPRARRRKHLWIPAAAAAAVVIMLASPHSVREPTARDREGPVTTTVSPRGVAPVGSVDSILNLTWSAVPHADRYRVRLFDTAGSVLWEHETTDTSVVLATSVRLQANRSYYWKVEANTGFDRTASSELVEFSVRHPRGQ